jgi:PP-loop superfamily ATP-utilizing enzyme
MKAVIVIEVGPDQATGCMMTPEEVHAMLKDTVRGWEFDSVTVMVEGVNSEEAEELGKRKLSPLTPLKAKARGDDMWDKRGKR